MKKRQLALISGILFSLLAVLGCSNSTGGDSGSGGGSGSGSSGSDKPKSFTVTFEAGENAYYTSYGYKKSTFTKTVEEGQTVNELVPEIYMSAADNFYYLYEYDHYCISGTDTVFDFSTPITKDITLVAQYGIAKVKALTVTSGKDGKTLKISFNHPKLSSYKDIEGLEYVLNVSHGETLAHSETGEMKRDNSVEYKDLEHGTKYDIEVTVQYHGKKSKSVSETGIPTLYTRVLMLMYMDGDNNLNDPIFTDLNEAEYGISKLSESVTSDINVLALWDGLATEGDGKVTPTKGFPGAKLLKLGADDELDDELSENTIDLSAKFDWLSKNEVDMSDKQTVVNFITSALSLYNSNNIVLQFSNHGGGPRSYLPKKATLKNGKTITLYDNTGRRSMCWDESAGGETFLKTTDLSAALEEVGFNSDNKVKLIIEDVCLGASIEEIYELSEYTECILASPNNVPADGLDYATFIENIETTAFYSSTTTYLSWAGREACKKFKEDNSLTAEQSNTLYELILAQNNIDASTLTAKEVDDIKSSISLNNSMNTISLFNTSYYFSDIVEELNKVVTEILANGNKTCTKIFYDTEKDGITTTGNENTVTITRIEAIKEICLRPYDPINYQGTYSWLYDLGYVVDNIAAIADMENWYALNSSLQNIARSLYLAKEYCWRDGCGYPTYSYDYVGTYYKYGWLCGKENADSRRLHYGLTISGETIKYTVDGDTVTIVNGDYPSWYTDLKFGKDCKWNDLLKALFPQQQ